MANEKPRRDDRRERRRRKLKKTDRRARTLDAPARRGAVPEFLSRHRSKMMGVAAWVAKTYGEGLLSWAWKHVVAASDVFRSASDVRWAFITPVIDIHCSSSAPRTSSPKCARCCFSLGASA